MPFLIPRRFHFLLPFLLAACATPKSYQWKSEYPNLGVQIQMEDGFLQRELADLYIYEVRGKCEQFFHGFVALREGRTEVSLPLGKDLILSFVRANLGYGYSLTNEDTIRFCPQPERQYRIRLRERNGSRELLFLSKQPGKAEFHEFSGQPLPSCEKVHFIE